VTTLLEFPPALLFCWLLTIFRLGLAFGRSEGGKLAKLVTFLTDEEDVDDDDETPVVVGGAGGGGAGVADALVAEDTVEAVLEAEFVEDDELPPPELLFPEVEAEAAAAAAATLFRLK
jgi:hypothetical protein